MDNNDGKIAEKLVETAREAERGKLAEQYGQRVIDGETWINTDYLSKVEKPDPAPTALALSSLASLVDYIEDNPDDKFTDERARFVVVESPTVVKCFTGAELPNYRRVVVACATAQVPTIPFGTPVQAEQFLIIMRTLFDQDAAALDIVKRFSTIEAKATVRLADDGVSQEATFSKGVRGSGYETVPSNVELKPFRTFAEVTQPSSTFLLRLHNRGDGEKPLISLHEADMGQWRVAAMKNVKGFLEEALKDVVAVYG